MSSSSSCVFLYARASSDEQKRKGLSVPAQLKALRQWAGQEGWTVAGEYTDDGISGRTDKHPGFQQMIAAACAKERPATAILVWKFDRYSRDRVSRYPFG
jgi:site-specific DNA recombinase